MRDDCGWISIRDGSNYFAMQRISLCGPGALADMNVCELRVHTFLCNLTKFAIHTSFDICKIAITFFIHFRNIKCEPRE